MSAAPAMNLIESEVKSKFDHILLGYVDVSLGQVLHKMWTQVEEHVELFESVILIVLCLWPVWGAM